MTASTQHHPQHDGSVEFTSETTRAWFLRTRYRLSFLERLKLLFGAALFVGFEAPSGHCSAGCELRYRVANPRFAINDALATCQWEHTAARPDLLCGRDAPYRLPNGKALCQEHGDHLIRRFGAQAVSRIECLDSDY